MIEHGMYDWDDEPQEKKIPKAISEGTLTIAGITMRTFVLDDGSRMIEAGDFAKFMDKFFDPLIPFCVNDKELEELGKFIKKVQ